MHWGIMDARIRRMFGPVKTTSGRDSTYLGLPTYLSVWHCGVYCHEIKLHHA